MGISLNNLLSSEQKINIIDWTCFLFKLWIIKSLRGRRPVVHCRQSAGGKFINQGIVNISG